MNAQDRYRVTRAAVLRQVLSDGEWHENTELAKAVGWRFGGALYLIRLGTDGGPAWTVEEERLTANGRVWRYRFTGINPDPPKPGGTWKGRALAAERELKALKAALKATKQLQLFGGAR
jgi:hypothetical protein